MIGVLSKRLRNLPLIWVAYASGLLVFALTRSLPGSDWIAPQSGQALLDQGFVMELRNHPETYSVVEGYPQTFGAHVLTHYALSVISGITGDLERAGVWLSLVGVMGTLGGILHLCFRIFPLRNFGLLCMLGLGGLGTLQFSLSSDPSTALGMALVSWAMVFFLSALDKNAPSRVFLSALCIGLLAYIRFELTVIWLLMVVYLLFLRFSNSQAKQEKLPLLGMAVGGSFMLFLVLWPMLDRNLILAGTPLLPGFDAEVVVGAPAEPGVPAETPFVNRWFEGLHLLMFHPRGPGWIAGLLWPVGLVFCTLYHRKGRLPFFWMPMLFGSFTLLNLMSFVTGEESYVESLQILTPLLFPFSILVPALAVFHWFQKEPRDEKLGLQIWVVTALGMYILVQIPQFFSQAFGGQRRQMERYIEGVEAFAQLQEADRTAPLLTDVPGLFLVHGKNQVFGLRGETDWEIQTAKYSNGSIIPEDMLEYLRDRKVELIHLVDVENPLVNQLELQENSPEFSLISGFSPPHRVYRVRWP